MSLCLSVRGELIPGEKMEAALIIIDMQNDFCHAKGYVGKVGRKHGMDYTRLRRPIEKIIELKKTAKGAGMPVIYTQTLYEGDFMDHPRQSDLTKEAREAKFLVKGTWNAQVIDELTPEKGDYVLVKKGYGAFLHTHLDILLRNLGVDTLIVTGVGATVCVETTAREGRNLGYEIIMVSDATEASDSDEAHLAMLNIMARIFGKVMKTSEVIAWLGEK